MSRPNLFEVPVWDHLEQLVLEIFSQGLVALADETYLPRQEDFLNRRLLECCRKSNHGLRREGRGLPCPIFYEASNQPLADEEAREARLRNRPDFTCGFHDDLAENYAEADILYTIECKRLGSPSTSSWILNTNYVVNGISRCEDPECGYADGTVSGMMVGYIQSMEPAEILAEVNDAAFINGFNIITLSPKSWVLKSVTVLNPHAFPRRLLPSPFRLNHLWVDLRHCEFFEVSLPAQKGKKGAKRQQKTATTKKGKNK